MQRELECAEHDRLLKRIPVQAAWLLLRCCVCLPAPTFPFTAAHDGAVQRCLSDLLGFADTPLPQAAARTACLPKPGVGSEGGRP